jgi:uncharacterized repeat protein (TIGR01451 family)
MMRHFKQLFTLFLLSLLSFAALAADAGAIKLTGLAEVEQVTLGKDGKNSIKRVPPEKAVPGTEVIFTTVFENVSTKPAGDIVITNPVPNNTAYKAGSATGKDTVVDFSVDGGRSFAAADKLKVKGGDGKPRTAQASDYTHIRWQYKKQLPPGKSGDVGFRAIIK